MRKSSALSFLSFMARAGKKKSAATPSKQSSSHTPAVDIPEPWTRAPSSLDPFLANLPADHIYITSIDKHDSAFKRRLFIVPLLLNIFLTILIIYRIYTSIPTYGGIFLSLLGYESPQKLDVRGLPRSEALAHWVRRAGMFLGDFVLLRIVGVWPIEFFLGRGLFSGNEEAGPVGWRRAVSFRDTEVVIRRSRRWDQSIFHKESMSGEGTQNVVEDVLRQGEQGQMFQERILPAVNAVYLQRKTGYQMLDKSWDLYFSGMIEAHALIDDKALAMGSFRTTVLVHTERWGWLAWEVWKAQEHDETSEGSRKLQHIKDTITAMGKENLFFRIIEVIQAETSIAGPFTSARRQKAITKIKAEFEDQKVDFEEFLNAIGGIESMPGLEITE